MLVVALAARRSNKNAGILPGYGWESRGQAARATTIMSIFYDPYGETERHRRNLPHLEQTGKMYFVTFRLADSIPKERLRRLEAQRQQWRERNPRMVTTYQWIEYYRLFCDRVEGWLDDNVGQCLLARPECAAAVDESLHHFDGDHYKLDHTVIMPNHVHVLFLENQGHTIEEIVARWKSFTAKAINKLCERTGTLWQRESFDHIVRSQLQLEKYRSYIIENAAKAHGRAALSTAKATP